MDDGRHTVVGSLLSGFVTIGGNWFAMFLDGGFNRLDPAFPEAVMTLLTAVFVLAVIIADRLEAVRQSRR